MSSTQTEEISLENFITSFSNIIQDTDGILNIIYKIVFNLGNDVNSYNQPPHLNPLRSQCSTTTNLINFLLSDGKYIPEISGYITNVIDKIKFQNSLDVIKEKNMLLITFNINGANYANDDISGGRGPYFPGHIFNMILDKDMNEYNLIQSFLYNYTAKSTNYNEQSIDIVLGNYYDIFVNPLDMKFRKENEGDDLMKKWKDVTDTDAYGYPNKTDIIGECRPKFLGYSIKYQSRDDYFYLFMKNIVRFYNLLHYKILNITSNSGSISSFNAIRAVGINEFIGMLDENLKEFLKSAYLNRLRNILLEYGINNYYVRKGLYLFNDYNTLIFNENNDEEDVKTVNNFFVCNNISYLELEYGEISGNNRGNPLDNPLDNNQSYFKYFINNMPLSSIFLMKNANKFVFIKRLDTNIFFIERSYINSRNEIVNYKEQKDKKGILAYLKNDENKFYF